MYSFYIKLFFVGNLLFSCNFREQSQNELVFKDFRDTYELVGEEIRSEGEYIGNPISFFKIDSLLFTLDPTNKNLFKILNLNTNYFIKNKGIRGSGPGEIITPISCQLYKNKKIGIYDYAQKEFFLFQADSLVLNDKYLPEVYIDCKNDPSANFYSAQLINQNLLIGVGVFEDGGRYGLMDNNDKFLYSRFNFPKDGKKNIETTHKALAYQGNISVKPDGKAFVFAAAFSPILEIIKVDENNELEKIKDIHYAYPDYRTEKKNGGYSSPMSSKSPMGFPVITTTDSYIYTIYSGKTFEKYRSEAFYGNHLLVYDWNGNPIKHYLLNISLKQVFVEEDKILYGIPGDTENFQFVKYELK